MLVCVILVLFHKCYLFYSLILILKKKRMIVFSQTICNIFDDCHLQFQVVIQICVMLKFFYA